MRAGDAWAFRWAVEIDAEGGFAWLAQALEAEHFPASLVNLCQRCATDETRHARLCERIARMLGKTSPATLSGPVRLAPGTLDLRDALLYEAVARGCIAETESMATLTDLLPRVQPPILEVVREIARDEIRHAQLGWAVLAYEAERRDVAFLGNHLESMLRTGGAPLFGPGDDREQAAELGVLSRDVQRRIFVETLEKVIFPGLGRLRIGTEQARAWLDRMGRLGME